MVTIIGIVFVGQMTIKYRKGPAEEEGEAIEPASARDEESSAPPTDTDQDDGFLSDDTF